MRKHRLLEKTVEITVLLTSVLAGFLLLMGIRPALAEAVSPMFIDVTDAVGMSRFAQTYGLGWGDFDGDGYLDLMGAPRKLYHNNGDGTFTDVLDGSGIESGGDRKDSGWVDYDGDGDLDLYITVGALGGQGEGPNQLYENDGLGSFVDVAELLLIAVVRFTWAWEPTP